MLTGCGGSKAPAEDKAQTEEADDTEEAAGAEETGDDGEEASADEAQSAIDERKAAAEENGEYEKIVIGFFDWTGTPAGIDRINEACLHIPRKRLDWMWSFRLCLLRGLLLAVIAVHEVRNREHGSAAFLALRSISSRPFLYLLGTSSLSASHASQAQSQAHV